jgi:hypothetical protein
LRGNCQTGQLISQGYDQTSNLGRILRDKYIGEDIPDSGDFKLFKNAIWDDSKANHTYFRSDDMERTLLSGQNLLNNFFDVQSQTIVNWHTGDYLLDQIQPNSIVCPRLNQISSAAYASDTFLSWNASLHNLELTLAANEILGSGVWEWTNMLDCLMTTVCSGKGIPYPNSTSPMTSKIFDSLLSYVEYEFAYKALFNGAEWSKLGIGNLAWDIKTHLENMISLEKDHSSSSFPHPPKFVLYSGHDITIMSLLAAILEDKWDKKWTPYASILNIELYEAKNDEADLFRIIYNGEELVIPLCQEETLCSSTMLMKTLEFAKEFMPCGMNNLSNNLNYNSTYDEFNYSKHDHMKFALFDVISLIILSTIFGVMIGASMVKFNFLITTVPYVVISDTLASKAKLSGDLQSEEDNLML